MFILKKGKINSYSFFSTYSVYGRILNLISGRILYVVKAEYQVKPLHIAKYIVMVNGGKSF